MRNARSVTTYIFLSLTLLSQLAYGAKTVSQAKKDILRRLDEANKHLEEIQRLEPRERAAISMQKIWRGKKARELINEMKKKRDEEYTLAVKEIIRFCRFCQNRYAERLLTIKKSEEFFDKIDKDNKLFIEEVRKRHLALKEKLIHIIRAENLAEETQRLKDEIKDLGNEIESLRSKNYWREKQKELFLKRARGDKSVLLKSQVLVRLPRIEDHYLSLPGCRNITSIMSYMFEMGYCSTEFLILQMSEFIQSRSETANKYRKPSSKEPWSYMIFTSEFGSYNDVSTRRSFSVKENDRLRPEIGFVNLGSCGNYNVSRRPCIIFQGTWDEEEE